MIANFSPAPTASVSRLPETISEALRAVAHTDPERVLVDDGHPRTVGWINETSARLALRLVARGVSPGDRIAIQAPNGVAWAIAAFAALQLGATIVPVSTRYSSAEAADLIERSGAGVVFASPSFLGRSFSDELASASLSATVAELGDSGEIRGLPGREDASDLLADSRITAEADALRRAVTSDTVAFVQFTSGTTGAPKGALLRHGSLVATTVEWIDATGLRHGDRYAVVAPFFHISGYKTGLLACLLSGAVVHPIRRFDPRELLELIAGSGISVLQGPPTLYLELIEQALAAPDLDTGSLRLAVTGGTVVPPAVVARMRRALGLDAVVTSYGLTEASGVVTICRPGDSDEVVGTTSGRAIPSATVKVAPMDPPEADGRGEILVRSPHLMSGYLDNPEATAAAIDADGWLHTGDIGYLDDRSNLVLTGRLTDMFIVGGFNAYPAEIEAVLNEHESVQTAAVVGVPDERLGEVGAAFVIPSDPNSIDVDELAAFAAQRLAGFKRPETITVVDVLPLNSVGKVDKTALRESWIRRSD